MVIGLLDDHTCCVCDLLPLICGFDESCTIVHCITSQLTNMYPKMCSIDIFDNRQLLGWNLKGGLFDPRFGGKGAVCDRRWAHSIARPWVLSSSPIETYGLSLTVFELSGWLQKRFRPSDLETMTNTVLEATAPSSGKNCPLGHECTVAIWMLNGANKSSISHSCLYRKWRH